MLVTSVEGLVLEPLTGGHAGIVHALMQRNRAHLTAHGDFSAQVEASEAEMRAELDEHGAGHQRFGIFLDGELIGRMDLIAVDPPRYSLGYWLAGDATGQGYAVAGLAALIAFARDGLGASDLYAGVTHGNERSERLLQRLGFAVAQRFATYTRFHRALGPV